MTRAKEFDCAEMKTKIQRQLLEERTRLGEDAARKLQWDRALANPLIRKFWEQAQKGTEAA
ncbi:MAG: hypothetical protein ACKV22_03230 [Bryobacteraceae bacterium]